MNDRRWIYLAIGGLLLMLLLVRWSCIAHVPALPEGESPEARLQQISAMRRRKAAGDVPMLAELAEHRDRRVVRAATAALGEWGTSEATSILQRLLAESDRPEVRAAAADALGRGGEGHVDTLVRTLRTDPSNDARVGAARGLARLSGPDQRKALAALVAALSDPDVEVRRWAIRGVHRVSVQRFLYEPGPPPPSQKQRIAYIERRLKERGLLGE